MFLLARLFLAVLLISWAPIAGHAQDRAVDLRDHGKLLRIVGRENSDRLGISLETGDLTGDGVDDLIIGSDRAEDETEDDSTGRIDIFSGADLGGTGTIDLRDPQGVPLLTVFGEFDQPRFGARTVLGDFDGDGTLDLAVSAPFQEVPDRDEAGRVYLFFGDELLAAALNPAVPFLIADSAAVLIDGGTADAQAGLTLAAGSFDLVPGDELVIGAPGSRGPDGDDVGRAFVLGSRSRIEWEARPRISLADATISEVSAAAVRVRAFLGLHEFDRFGESLGIGDFDADGVPDLFIGADNQDEVRDAKASRFLNIGGVNMFRGPGVLSTFLEWDPRRGPADHTFYGRSEFDQFGDQIALFNWDGLPGEDMWVSAPFAEPTPIPEDDDPEDDRGHLSMISGGAGFAVPNPVPVRWPELISRWIVGPTDESDNESLFGGEVRFADVVDGGPIELIVAASLFDDFEDRSGRAGAVYVFPRSAVDLSGPVFPLITGRVPGAVRIVGEEEGDRLGLRVEVLEGSPGGRRLVLGAPQASTNDEDFTGVVYILDVNSMVFPLNGAPTPTHIPTPTQTMIPTATSTFVPAVSPDLNSDGVLDLSDLFLMSVEWMQPAKAEGDLDAKMLLELLEGIQNPKP